jgi:hypothetical protein
LFQSVLQCLQFISQFLLPPKAHGFGYEWGHRNLQLT